MFANFKTKKEQKHALLKFQIRKMMNSFKLVFTLATIVITTLVVLESSTVAVDAKPHPTKPVTELRSEQKYNELINSESKIALVYFYAGWCAKCKWFTKHDYSRVGEHFGRPEYHDHVAITKMDGTNFPKLSKSLGIEGYPAIFLYSIDEIGKPEKYTGELGHEQLQAWVEEHLHKRMTENGHMIPPKRKKKRIL